MTMSVELPTEVERLLIERAAREGILAAESGSRGMIYLTPEDALRIRSHRVDFG